MQKSGSTPTQNAPPFFSSAASLLNPSKSRPGTSSGEPQSLQQDRPNVLVKERRPSLSKKASFSRKRRPSVATNGPGIPFASTSASPSSTITGTGSTASIPATVGSGGAGVGRRPSIAVITDTGQPPALPDLRSAMSRSTPTPTMNGYSASSQLAPPPNLLSGGSPNEATLLHQHIQEMANKRISTLEYLKKAHEGRVYWFNALLFEKPDLLRMPYFDARKLARRATNYLLLGLSLPTVIDYNSATPLEFLRSLNILLNEFDSFQQLHSENGTSAGSLSRARLPNMFRRAGPGGKTRRTSGAANEIGYPLEPTESNGGSGGGGSGSGGAGGGNNSVMSFATSETDLLPGEEYTHLLTPSLPFDPDFFETFATLCDVLIDFYTRLLGLIPTPRECTPPVAELFTKADSRVRKIIIQGVVKEFEDSSRVGVKTEVANIGKVVLSGLM